MLLFSILRVEKQVSETCELIIIGHYWCMYYWWCVFCEFEVDMWSPSQNLMWPPVMQQTLSALFAGMETAT